MRVDEIHIRVDGDTMLEFAREGYGSLKKMASESGVNYVTLLRAKERGYLPLGTAVKVCEATDKTVTDVFGCQDDYALNRIIFALRGVENDENWSE